MQLFIGEEKSNLLASTIASIVKHYANSDKIDGIFMRCNVETGPNIQNDKCPTIRLFITFTEPLIGSEYLEVSKTLKPLKEETGIKVSADFCDASDFGMTQLYLMSMGEVNASSNLPDAEILFDRNNKYKELQDISRRIKPNRKEPLEFVPPVDVLKRVRVPENKPKFGQAS